MQESKPQVIGLHNLPLMTLKMKMLNLVRASNPKEMQYPTSYPSSHPYKKPNNRLFDSSVDKQIISLTHHSKTLVSVKKVTFSTCSEVEAIIEKEAGSPSTTLVELMPPYLRPPGCKAPKFLKFDGRKGDLKENVWHFLGSMGVFSCDSTSCLRILLFSDRQRLHLVYQPNSRVVQILTSSCSYL